MTYITCWNVPGTCFKPNRICTNWKSQWSVVTYVFNLSRPSIYFCQNPELTCNAEKHRLIPARIDTVVLPLRWVWVPASQRVEFMIVNATGHWPISFRLLEDGNSQFGVDNFNNFFLEYLLYFLCSRMFCCLACKIRDALKEHISLHFSSTQRLEVLILLRCPSDMTKTLVSNYRNLSLLDLYLSGMVKSLCQTSISLDSSSGTTCSWFAVLWILSICRWFWTRSTSHVATGSRCTRKAPHISCSWRRKEEVAMWQSVDAMQAKWDVTWIEEDDD